MSTSAKPLPELSGATGEFYGFCRAGELRFQRCTACRAWRHVPREMCAECGAFEFEWARSTGRGRVFSWTVVTRALHPAFAGDVPYAPVIVEMEEGVRVLSQMVEMPIGELAIDLPVEVVFEPASETVTLPKFRRARA